MTEYISYAIKGYAENYTGLPKACWQAIILTFIESIAIGVCFFLSLYFVDNLHFSVATAGMLISCYGVGTAVGGIVGGKLSDIISPKTVSLVGLFLLSLAFLLLTKLTSVESLMLNLFILGVAGYSFAASNDVWMLNQCKGRSDIRLKAVNISRVASNLGVGISGTMVGIVTSAGFQSLFYLFGTLIFLSAVYSITQRENDAFSKISLVENASSNITIHKTNTSMKIVLLILLCEFAVGLIISQLSATYPIYVQSAFPEFGIKAVSILFILDTALIVLFQAPLINYLKRYNRLVIAGLGAFLMGFGMLVLSFSFVFALGLISCAIWTTGEMLFIPTAQLLCYEKAAENKKGQIMGIYKAVFALSMIVGPAVGSAIYQYAGGDMLWYLSAVVGVICLIACWYYKKHN